jgi:capsular polysaccharide biosynthesis protein
MSHMPLTSDPPAPSVARESSRQLTPPSDTKPSLGMALRRFPLLAIMPVIVLVAAGITLGLQRHPVYTASAELNIGVTDANSQATPGYEEAAQQLASSYSRQATSQLTTGAVAARTHQSAGLIASRLSSSAVPDSPTFYINATGPSIADAVSLANMAAHVLQRSVDAAKRADGKAVQLSRYTKMERRADTLEIKAASLKNRRAANPSRVSAAAVHTAALEAQVAVLEANAQSSKYTSAYIASSGTNLQILNPASSALSDRKTYLERYVIVGLVAGLVVGVALAYLLALARPWRRRI